MKIPFLNLKKEAEYLVENGLIEELKKIILSGKYLFGSKMEELEDIISKIFNAEVILVGSGTDAIYLSLLAGGIGKNDIVLAPAFSAIPTAVAIKMTGAKIKYIDVCIETGNIDLDKTDMFGASAIVGVHLYGNPIGNIFNISNMCKENNIFLIEDCAQCFGSKSNYNFTGLFGNCGAFSFYPTKNIGGFGDAGCVITKDTSLAQKIRELRFYGQKNSSAMGDITGMNSRMDEIQASILIEKFKIWDEIKERRKSILKKYNEFLGDCTIKWNDGSVPHLFPIFVKNRKVFISEMKQRGIDTVIHYPFTLPSSIDKIKETFPNAEFFAHHVVSIPFHPYLTEEEMEYIFKTTRDVYEIISNR